MPTQEKISVVMPAYNASLYIAPAIESILCQTFRDFELIIVDDGSTDNTIEIVKRYSMEDRRVRLIENPHAGICYTRNTAIEAARYSWIAVMDADDIALPQRLEKQIQAATANKRVIVWGSYVQHINSNGDILTLQKQGPTSEQEYKNLIDKGEIPFIVHSTAMFKKETLSKIGTYDPLFPLAQDFELISRMAYYGPVVAIPEPLVLYRVHSHSATMLKFFTQQQLARWIVARHKARLCGLPLPDYDEFIAKESDKSPFSRLIQDVNLMGQYCYRKAGLYVAQNNYLKASAYMGIAIASHPTYAIKRLWKQRFSPEARRHL